MLRLRKLFQRAQPDERELRVMHGIFADAQRMAQIATGKLKSEKGVQRSEK
jgi:tRNA (cytidine32/uridine32-2'-O)-methyltransferase